MSAGGRAAAGGLLRFGVLDRYVLGLTLKPMFWALGVVLTGLLLERVLRLVDVLASAGAPVVMVFALSANLIPHYLAFAVPAAFALGVFSAISRLSAGAELEAMLASGVSVNALMRPLIAIGVVLALVSFAVSGFLAPYSRYAYRDILNASVAYAWRAHAPAETFIVVKDGLTMTADAVDATGRRLTGVFIQDRQNGGETVTTAAGGTLELTPDGKELQLKLHKGLVIRNVGAARPSTMRFNDLVVDKKFALEAPPFRPRGGNERELTSPELLAEIASATPAAPKRKLQAEFHSRLVRAVSLVFLPLLIVPLSMTMRRSSRFANMAVAGLLLILHQNAIEIGQTLAQRGAGPAALLCWAPLVVFVAVSMWLFATSTDRPGDTAISRAIDRVGAGAGAVARLAFRRPAAARV